MIGRVGKRGMKERVKQWEKQWEAEEEHEKRVKREVVEVKGEKWMVRVEREG